MDDYLKEGYRQLNNDAHYKWLSSDKTQIYNKKITDFLNLMEKHGHLTQDTTRYLL